MKSGRYRTIGNGRNHIPRIHVDDCADAYMQLLRRMPLGEKLIIADDYPCTVAEFNSFMAQYMGVPEPKSLPVFVVRMMMGKLIYETVTMDCVVSNVSTKQRLDWKLQYPTFREGLPAAIREIQELEGR
jgi:nucleoside-diphosphate-sugar epimerase